jgi:hypothetical protein
MHKVFIFYIASFDEAEREKLKKAAKVNFN